MGTGLGGLEILLWPWLDDSSRRGRQRWWPSGKGPKPGADCSVPRRPRLPAVSRAQTIAPFGGKLPTLGEDVFVAPSASVIGDVTLGAGSSVWYGAVIRGAPALRRAA